MADIKQAAKWMASGKHVTRSILDFGYLYTDSHGWIKFHDSVDNKSLWPDMLEVEDFLADDWEIVG